MSVIPKKPLNFAATMAAVDKFSSAHNIPTKTYPALVQAGEGATPQATAPTRPKTLDRKVTLELPAYLVEEINSKTVRPLTTRYLLMKALKADGYTVHDEDMIVDRRKRS